MAIEQVVNVPSEILLELGRIGLWIQGIGLIIVIWLIFQIILLINNRIRRKQLYIIENRLENIEKKLDRLMKE